MTLTRKDLLPRAFGVLRNMHPTWAACYGRACDIFERVRPEEWHPDEVEALFNLLGVIANGTENLSVRDLNDENEEGIAHDVAFMVTWLRDAPVPGWFTSVRA